MERELHDLDELIDATSEQADRGEELVAVEELVGLRCVVAPPARKVLRMAARPCSGWSTAATTKSHDATASCWLPKWKLREKPWRYSTVGNGPLPLAGRPRHVSAGATVPDSAPTRSALMAGSSTSAPE